MLIEVINDVSSLLLNRKLKREDIYGILHWYDREMIDFVLNRFKDIGYLREGDILEFLGEREVIVE